MTPPSDTGGSTGSKESPSDITAVAVLVAPFAAGIGALAATGTIGSVQRNESEAISWALFLVLAAGTIWVASGLIPEGPTGWHKATKPAVRYLACIFALAGFIVGLNAAVSTANDEPRPQIDASLSDDARKLTTKVSASNMETEDRLAIFVDALTRGPTGSETDYTSEPVFRGYEGPNADGKVELTLAINLPKGPHTDVSVKAFTDDLPRSCDNQLTEDAEAPRVTDAEVKPGSGTGCVTLAIVPK